MKITINEPCHENWNKMTPNDQGAFCGSCQKNVIDFSTKSISEIKHFFTDLPKSQNVCGRFKEIQLQEMSFEHFMSEFMSWKMMKRAAVIVYLVLSATMFSSCSDEEVVGKMEVVPPARVIQDTLEKNVVGKIMELAVDSICDKDPIQGQAIIKGAGKTEKARKQTNKETSPVKSIVMGNFIPVKDTPKPVNPPVIKMGKPLVN